MPQTEKKKNDRKPINHHNPSISHISPSLFINLTSHLCLTRNLDLPRTRGLGLRHNDGQNAILQTRLDIILVDTAREAKAPVELAHTALGNPVLWLFGVILLGYLLVIRRCGRDLLILVRTLLLGGFVGVFDGGLLGVRLAGFLDGALRGVVSVVDEVRTNAFLADDLVAARDGEGVCVGPLDVDVLLLYAGELAVEFVVVFEFLDVKLGGEGAEFAEQGIGVAVGVVVVGRHDATVVVVHQAEEGREFLREAWEERHFWCAL